MSCERPSAIAHNDAPAPRWQDTIRGGRSGSGYSSAIRRRAAERLGFLGVSIDAAANETATPDAEITAARAAVRVLVVEAREDLQIAGEVERLLARDG